MMDVQQKTKRKGNPRRSMLIQVLLGIMIMIIGMLIAVAVYQLRPNGAEIVYIAPDDDGVENIWLADVNNPEKPRQLTHLDAETIISPVSNLQVIEENRTALFSTGEFVPEQFWRLNLDTSALESIFICDDLIINCPSVTISPDGNWLAYFDRVIFEEDGKTISAYIHNLETSGTTTLYTVRGAGGGVPFPYLGWFGASSQIVYQPDLINDPFTFEFYDVYQEQVMQTIILNELQPVFNTDGSFYALIADNPITLHSIDNSVENLVEAVAESEEERLISGLMDWHPDNEQALVTHITIVGCRD